MLHDENTLLIDIPPAEGKKFTKLGKRPGALFVDGETGKVLAEILNPLARENHLAKNISPFEFDDDDDDDLAVCPEDEAEWRYNVREAARAFGKDNPEFSEDPGYAYEYPALMIIWLLQGDTSDKIRIRSDCDKEGNIEVVLPGKICSGFISRFLVPQS